MIQMFKPYISKKIDLTFILTQDNQAFGKYGLLFEKSLKKFFDKEHLITLNSYNIAYFVLLRSLKIRSGDEVLLSPLTCLESTQPLVAYGLNIKWVDVNKKTGTMDPDDLNRKINKKTKLVIHNHFAGNVGFIDEINTICEEHNVTVVEDCSEAFGSEYKGKIVGTGNNVYIFNFSAIRNPSSISGSAIIFNSEDSFNLSKLIRDNGIDRDNFRLDNGEINQDFDIAQIGYSGLMNEINSYIGYLNMQEIHLILDKQRKIASVLKRHLNKYIPEVYDDIYEKNVNSNYWVYGILCKNKELTKNILNKLEFSTSSIHVNNDIYSIFGPYKKMTGVNKFLQHFIAIPSGWWIEERDLEKIKV